MLGQSLVDMNDHRIGLTFPIVYRIKQCSFQLLTLRIFITDQFTFAENKSGRTQIRMCQLLKPVQIFITNE